MTVERIISYKNNVNLVKFDAARIKFTYILPLVWTVHVSLELRASDDELTLPPLKSQVMQGR
jgi:hypothetical protein